VCPPLKVVQSVLLYPRAEDRSIQDEADEARPILVVLASTRVGELARRFGQELVGLDGIFKHTKLGWPIWTVVVEDDEGHGWPLATIISSSETVDVLYHGLKILLCQFHAQKVWTSRVNAAEGQMDGGKVLALILELQRASKQSWAAAAAKLKTASTPQFWISFVGTKRIPSNRPSTSGRAVYTSSSTSSTSTSSTES
jgi:hypothetical protein